MRSFITDRTDRFQQDKDPQHRSKRVRTYLDSNHIVYPKVPAHSPEINPIDMVCEKKSQLDPWLN